MRSKLMAKLAVPAVVLLLGHGPVHSAPSPAAAEPTYQALRQARLSGQALRVEGLRLQRDVLELNLEQGTVHLAEPIGGRHWLAVFKGRGRMRLLPAHPAELHHLRLVTGSSGLEALEDDFDSAVLVWTDGTFEEMTARAAAATSDVAEGRGKLEELRNLFRKDLRQNLEARVLQDFLSEGPDGYFLARIEGKRHSKLLYTFDPEGVSPTGFGTEPSGLLSFDATHGGQWYLAEALAAPGGASAAPFEATHYRIDTRLAKGADIEATARIRLRARSGGHRVVPLRMLDKLRVREAKLLPAGTALPWIREDEKEGQALALVLPEPAAAGQELELEIRYGGSGVLTDTGEGNYFVDSYLSWYPQVPVFAELATYEMTFCHPKGREVVAVGVRGRSSKEGGLECTEWRSEVPVHQVGFNYGKFKRLERQDPDTGLMLEVYTNPGTPDFIREINARLRQADTANWQDTVADDSAQNTRVVRPDLARISTSALAEDALVDALNSVRIFTAYFGALPFRRLAVTQQPNFGLGVALPTLVYLPYTAFLDSYQRHQFGLADADMTSYVQVVGPHEVAHQWWGHLVAPASYHDAWLAEGIAHFSAALVLEKADGAQRAQEFWRRERAHVLGKTPYGERPNDAGPIWLGRRLETQRSRGAYRPAVYGKGAFVMHMLRMMMQGPRGQDDAFVTLMRDFTKACRERPCSTADLQSAVERHMTPEMDVDGNRKMDWFFQQWVYGIEVPAFELNVKLSPTPDGKTKVEGTLRQKGVSEGFRSLVPIYLDMGGERLARIGRTRLTGTAPVSLDAVLPVAGAQRMLVNASHDILAYD
jgi:hypothetical protein